jgi:multiple sugar transport system ATP-binding protein
MRMADRIAVMDEGRIVQSASPQEIYESPVNRTVALAIGSPLMSFVEAAMVDGRLVCAAGEIQTIGQTCLSGCEDRKVSVGIRAPACRFVSADSVPDQPGVLITGKILRTRMIDGRTVTRIAVGSATVDAEAKDRSIAVGGDAMVFVCADDLYIFDEITGERLKRRE